MTRRVTLEEVEKEAQRIGQGIGKMMPPGWGFLLCLTEFGEDGDMTYVSSCHRSTIPSFCRELAEKLELGTGSLNIKSHDDPDFGLALDLLEVVFDVLTCPGVQVNVDADLIADGPGGEKEAAELAFAMTRDFKVALDRAAVGAQDLLKGFKPEEDDGRTEPGRSGDAP